LVTIDCTKLVAIFMFPGWRNPNNKKFNNIGERSNVWLVGGNNAEFNKNKWNWNNNNRNFGFSGRLLKNWNLSWSLSPQYCGVRSAFIWLWKMLDTEKLLLDLFQAYYDTRQHKRNINTRFEKRSKKKSLTWRMESHFKPNPKMKRWKSVIMAMGKKLLTVAWAMYCDNTSYKFI